MDLNKARRIVKRNGAMQGNSVNKVSPLVPFVLNEDVYGIHNTSNACVNVLKHYSLSKERPFRFKVSSQESNRSLLMSNYLNTTLKNSSLYLDNTRAHSSSLNYTRNIKRAYNWKNLTLHKLGKSKSKDNTWEKNIPSLKPNKLYKLKIPSLPGIIRFRKTPKTVIHVPKKEEKLISFSASKSKLETVQDIEAIKSKMKPYALIINCLKPMFFFNLKNENKESMSTPSFVRSFREAQEVSNKDNNCKDQHVLIFNDIKGDSRVEETL